MADHALAEAKAAGGNTLVFHVPDDDPADAERLKLEADLYEAVRNGEFSLHFQPITSSLSGGVVGVEALMRWHHPVHGLVPPSTFIPLAESIGLINYLGNWVLKAACMQLVQWDAIGIRLDYVSVNVSPQQFRDKRFTLAVREALALTGLDPRAARLRDHRKHPDARPRRGHAASGSARGARHPLRRRRLRHRLFEPRLFATLPAFEA